MFILGRGLDIKTLPPLGTFGDPFFMFLGMLKKYWPGRPQHFEPKSCRLAYI